MQCRGKTCLRYLPALREVGAANVSVEEAQARGNRIGRRCIRLTERDDVPDFAKVMAQRLLNGWVALAAERRAREEAARARKAQVLRRVSEEGRG